MLAASYKDLSLLFMSPLHVKREGDGKTDQNWILGHPTENKKILAKHFVISIILFIARMNRKSDFS
jgi:hypothetical protein